MFKHGIQGHDAWVHGIAISGDSRYILSASNDATIKVWRLETGEELITLAAHDGSVLCVDILDNTKTPGGALHGTLLVSGGQDCEVDLWELENDMSARHFHTLEGHTDIVTCVKISPNGQYVLSSSWDHTVKVWYVAPTVEDCEMVVNIEGHDDYVYCAAWSPDSKLIASGGMDNTVRVWDAQTGGKALVSFWEPSDGDAMQGNWVTCITFGHMTCHLLVSAAGKIITVSELDESTNATVKHTLKGHTDFVNSISLSADDKLLVSGGRDHKVLVWDVATRTPVMELPDGAMISHVRVRASWVNSVAWSPDNKYIVSGDGNGCVCVWEFGELVGHCVCVFVECGM
jgi:WD40 repeat protein